MIVSLPHSLLSFVTVKSGGTLLKILILYTIAGKILPSNQLSRITCVLPISGITLWAILFCSTIGNRRENLTALKKSFKISRKDRLSSTIFVRPIIFINITIFWRLSWHSFKSAIRNNLVVFTPGLVCRECKTTWIRVTEACRRNMRR